MASHSSSALSVPQHHPPCHLMVVLLCSGNGADTQSYRPRRDESQWWNRRDALVRCVSSYLFGPLSSNNNSRELILLYDGDYCRVHMRLEEDAEGNKELIPSEFTIISLWKEALTKAVQAAPKPPPVVKKNGLSCWAALAHTSNHNQADSIPNAKMIQDWNKRQLLEYLQKECSIDFLREHRLNSASSVILRKTNRGALAKVYQAWIKNNSKVTRQKASNEKSDPPKDPNSMQTIFQELMEPHKDDNLIAATLHESSDCELPCFGKLHSGEDENPVHLCLFLGAVRDMIPMEYQALQKACKSLGEIPFAKVRLGCVPEFTSKILSVVAFHHSQGRLAPAMKLLALGKKSSDDPSRKRNRPSTDKDSSTPIAQTPQLHILALVPLRSDQIVTDLEQRNRILWCLVRVLVCALWRSKLAGGRNATPLENSVTLVFLDGCHVTLQQKEWVSSLAEQHQAAPSEYQVLQALMDQIQKKGKATSSSNWDERVPEIVQAVLCRNNPSNEDDSVRSVISIERDCPTDVVERFYIRAEEGSTSDDYTTTNILAILPIASSASSLGTVPSTSDEAIAKIQKALWQSFQKIPTCRACRQSIVSSSNAIDWEASSIIMLQHFFYQNRLFIRDETVGESVRDTEDMGTTEDRADSKPAKKKKRHKHKKKKRKGE